MVVWQVFPGVPMRAIVFTHCAPCTFAEVGPPTLPVLFARARFGQANFFLRYEIRASSNHAQEAGKLIFKQSPWMLKLRGPFGFGFNLAKRRWLSVFEFRSECRGKCFANNAAVHRSLLAIALRFQWYAHRITHQNGVVEPPGRRTL